MHPAVCVSQETLPNDCSPSGRRCSKSLALAICAFVFQACNSGNNDLSESSSAIVNADGPNPCGARGAEEIHIDYTSVSDYWEEMMSVPLVDVVSHSYSAGDLHSGNPTNRRAMGLGPSGQKPRMDDIREYVEAFSEKYDDDYIPDHYISLQYFANTNRMFVVLDGGQHRILALMRRGAKHNNRDLTVADIPSQHVEFEVVAGHRFLNTYAVMGSLYAELFGTLEPVAHEAETPQ